MSEEDAFLDGIAANRADRTRLLVFADWLADRSDPREEFVRLHAKLLDMDGTEPEFLEVERRWTQWTGGTTWKTSYPLSLGLVPSPLTERWLDAMCRVFTQKDTDQCTFPLRTSSSNIDRDDFEQMDHIEPSGEQFLSFYHGESENFNSPFGFVAATILLDLWDDPFRPVENTEERAERRYLMPVTRGAFWNWWRQCCDGLRNPPPIPLLEADNHFLGAQYIEGDWNNFGMVALHQRDYFALFWSTTA